LYAAGYSADGLQDILENIDWEASLSGRAPRHQRSFRRKQDDNGFLIKLKVGIKNGKLKLPSGLITPNNLRLTLQGLINERSNEVDFDNLPIPFRAVATDLETGMPFVLEQGDLAAESNPSSNSFGSSTIRISRMRSSKAGLGFPKMSTFPLMTPLFSRSF
jgi:NTE family protein